MPKLPPKKVISKDEETQLLNEREKQVSEERLKFTEVFIYFFPHKNSSMKFTTPLSH